MSVETSLPEPVAAGGGARLQPTSRKQRIEVLDVLRGFALCGVMITNLTYTAGDAIVVAAEQTSTGFLDKIFRLLLDTSMYGKPRALFSFLFGLGFALQLLRAADKGADFVPRFVRRLSWLLVFGLLNMVFLWFGDILHVYALMGLALLAIRHQKNAMLLAIGLVLTIAPLRSIQADLFGQPITRSEAMREHRLEVFSQGSYLEVVEENIQLAFEQHSPAGWMTRCAFEAFGYFLLGYFVGRRRFFAELSKHLKNVRRLLVLGLAIGLVGDVLFVLSYRLGVDWGAGSWAVLTLIQANTPAKALFYITGIVLLYQLPWWRGKLDLLAPLGRMALTNYLMQSVLIMGVLYGVGPGLALIGRLSATACVLISLALAAIQVAFSIWWMKRFRFGPTEWLWRSLTYGKKQPMRVASTS